MNEIENMSPTLRIAFDKAIGYNKGKSLVDAIIIAHVFGLSLETVTLCLATK